MCSQSCPEREVVDQIKSNEMFQYDHQRVSTMQTLFTTVLRDLVCRLSRWKSSSCSLCETLQCQSAPILIRCTNLLFNDCASLFLVLVNNDFFFNFLDRFIYFDDWTKRKFIHSFFSNAQGRKFAGDITERSTRGHYYHLSSVGRPMNTALELKSPIVSALWDSDGGSICPLMIIVMSNWFHSESNSLVE